jgi:hypothetical protein
MVYTTDVEIGEAHELNALRLDSAPCVVFQSRRFRLEAHWFEIYHESCGQTRISLRTNSRAPYGPMVVGR